MIYSMTFMQTLIYLVLIGIVKPPVPVSPPVDPDPSYTQVIHERAQKIVDTLGIKNETKALHVRDLIADQYRSLSTLHDTRDAQIDAIKKHGQDDQTSTDLAITAIGNLTQELQDKLHTQYLLKLNAVLAPQQVDQVKDGMTYGIVTITYNSYLEMLPELTEEEKAAIKAYLIEAREHAIDGGSSEEKHSWFGKYKGRVNNYLSERGYDLKKASKERNERNKTRKELVN